MKVNNTNIPANTPQSFAKEFQSLTSEARVGVLKYLLQKCPKLGTLFATEYGTSVKEAISAIAYCSESVISKHAHILSIAKFGKNISKDSILPLTDPIESRKNQIDKMISEFRRQETIVPSEAYINADYGMRDENVEIRSQVESHQGISKKSLDDFKKLASKTLYYFPDAVIKNLYPECLDDDGKTIKKDLRDKLPENLLKAYESNSLLPESEVNAFIETLTGNPQSSLYRSGLMESNFESFNKFSANLSIEFTTALNALSRERMVRGPDNKTQVKLVVEKSRIEIDGGYQSEMNINGRSHTVFQCKDKSYIAVDNTNATYRKLEEHERIKYNIEPPSSKEMPVHQSMGGKQKNINLNKLAFLHAGTFYDSKKQKLYYTDGKKMYPMFNPLKNKDSLALLIASISFDKKLISPAESGIRIGRKLIELPISLPVTMVKSAAKVGSSTVIVFESGPKLVQLIIDKKKDLESKNGTDKKESIKLTILNPTNDSYTFYPESGVMTYHDSNLNIKVKNDGTVERVENKSFAAMTCGATALIDNTYRHYDVQTGSLVISEEKIVDLGDPLIQQTRGKLMQIQRQLGAILLNIGADLKYAIASNQNAHDLIHTLPVSSKDEYPVPAVLFFAEEMRQDEIKKGNYNELPTPADIQKIVEYINSKEEKTLKSLKFSRPSLPDLIPESTNPSQLEPGHNLKETYGISISPRHNGIIVGSVMQFDKDNNIFVPVNIPKIEAGNGQQITFSGEFDKQIQLKYPPNSQIINILVDGQPIEVKANNLGAYILDLDKRSAVSYTVAISDNLSVGENVATTSLNLPKDPKILKIVEKAKEISDLGSRIEYIKKEYAKISVYKINPKTKSGNLDTRFDNMKKGKYYYGVCADHAVLGHAILSAAGLNAVVLTGNACKGKKVVTSPTHACNGVLLADGRIIEVDLTPATFELKKFFNFLNLIEKKQKEPKIAVVNAVEKMEHPDPQKELDLEEESKTDTALNIDFNLIANQLIEANNKMSRAATELIFAQPNSDKKKELEADFQAKATVYHGLLSGLNAKDTAIDLPGIERILKGRTIRDSEMESTKQELLAFLSSKIEEK